MADIDILKEASELETYWQERDVQIREDRRILNLIKPARQAGQFNWVSNEPKVFYDTAVSLLSAQQPKFRLPLSINFEPDEKDKMNKAERFAIGLLRSWDEKQVRRGMGYWLHDLAWWVCSGWYAIFVMVAEENGETVFTSDFWDPLSVYPEWDNLGLRRCVRKFTTDKKTALGIISGWQSKGLKTEFREPRVGAQVTFINYWLRDGKTVYNGIYTKSTGESKEQSVKPLEQVKGQDRIPIHLGAIGQPDRSSDGWKSRIGENIIATNRDMYEYSDIFLRLWATIVAETAYPNIISKTRSGNPAVQSEDVRGYGQVISLKLEEQLDLLKHAAGPPEALQLFSILDRQKQKGSLPDVVYGGVQVELSGFAISQLMAAIKYKMFPYLSTMQKVVGMVISDTLLRYQRGKFPDVTLTTENSAQPSKGLFFVETYKPSDVPEALHIEVTIPLTTALDKTQQVILARQALEEPRLLSRETLWDEILDVQDSEQEYQRIIHDKMMDDPFVQGLEIIESMWQRETQYREQGNDAKANALRRYIQQKELQLGVRQNAPVMVRGSGTPSNVMPPEAGMAGISPDVTRAASGAPPPGVNRPSSGGSPRIVNPQGRALIQ